MIRILCIIILSVVTHISYSANSASAALVTLPENTRIGNYQIFQKNKPYISTAGCSKKSRFCSLIASGFATFGTVCITLGSLIATSKAFTTTIDNNAEQACEDTRESDLYNKAICIKNYTSTCKFIVGGTLITMGAASACCGCALGYFAYNSRYNHFKENCSTVALSRKLLAKHASWMLGDIVRVLPQFSRTDPFHIVLSDHQSLLSKFIRTHTQPANTHPITEATAIWKLQSNDEQTTAINCKKKHIAQILEALFEMQHGGVHNILISFENPANIKYICTLKDRSQVKGLLARIYCDYTLRDKKGNFYLGGNNRVTVHYNGSAIETIYLYSHTDV